MASRADNYLDIVDSEIPLFAFSTSAAFVPVFPAMPSTSAIALAVSSSTAFYIRKGPSLATTASLRIPPNTLYTLPYSGERISIIGDGVAGSASLTLMR